MGEEREMDGVVEDGGEGGREEKRERGEKKRDRKGGRGRRISKPD